MSGQQAIPSDEIKSKLQQLRSRLAASLQGKPDIEAWCTDNCLRRFLVARKLDTAKAEKMVQATIQWRQTYQPHRITWDEVKDEAQTGKTFISNTTDREGRTIVMMRPRNENSKDATKQIRFVVYNLELASRRADKSGVEKMTWLIDFEGYSMKNAPPPKVGIQTLQILQNHYPERLGLAVCYHPPWLFEIMYKAVSPFIDPVTSKKIFFCDKGSKGDTTMARFFDMELMEECVGGKSPPHFQFEAYQKQQIAEHAAMNGHSQ